MHVSERSCTLSFLKFVKFKVDFTWKSEKGKKATASKFLRKVTVYLQVVKTVLQTNHTSSEPHEASWLHFFKLLHMVRGRVTHVEESQYCSLEVPVTDGYVMTGIRTSIFSPSVTYFIFFRFKILKSLYSYLLLHICTKIDGLYLCHHFIKLMKCNLSR